MSFRVKAKAIKELFNKNNFRIISFSPLQTYKELELNRYFNFTCKGSNFPYIDIGNDYELEIEELSRDNYGMSYKIISCPSLEQLNIDNLSREESFGILKACTTSERLANNILDVYPDYIKRVLSDGEESIDTKPIKGVGKAYHKAYCRALTTKYKYFAMLNKHKEYELSVDDCKNLYKEFLTDDVIDKAIEDNPYKCLINVCNRSFNKADKMITTNREDLIDSSLRCSYVIYDILDRNENDCSTRINANVVYKIMKEEYNVPNLLPLVVDVCKNSEILHYDDETKYLSKASTWVAENKIADFIKEKVAHCEPLDWDYNKFKEIKDGILTEEQTNILKMICENNILIVNAPAGCVDCDTEYFNGEKWIKISNYDGGKVLQWNEDGTANLIEPLRYIKAHCDKMYHFETKYGLNQTLSPDHRVVFMKNNKLEVCTAEELYDEQMNKNGFNGKFMTSFTYNGEGIDLSDAQIKLMCAVICDETFYYNKNDNEKIKNRKSYNICRFHIKKERKKKVLRELFIENNLEWRESESVAEGYTDFYITPPRREKEFTPYWYKCTNHQLQIICDNILQWDGSINFTPNNKERKRFSTNNLNTANFIQFAFTACNKKATITINNRIGRKKINKATNKIYEDKTLEYNVTISDRNLLSFCIDKRPNHTQTQIEIVKPRDGYKYCFTVPSSYLVLRRNNHIFVSGNCGKTSAMNAVLQMIEFYGKTYTCVSFTGRASKRLSEQTNRPASTIHKACLSGEINTDFLIIDEASMLSIDLMCMLINAVNSNPMIKILMIGDVSQIPSISLGRVMKDIIESNKVPVCTLTKCFRFDQGGMSMISTLCRQGKFYLNSNEDEIVMGTNKDYKFVKFNGQIEQIIDEYAKLINKGIKKENISILSPLNIKEFGAFNINSYIQAYINPPLPNEENITIKNNGRDIIFRKGDLVMNTKNNYEALTLAGFNEMKESSILTKEDVSHTAIFNGETGKVLSIEDGYMQIQFGENIIVFDKFDAHRLLLAYASNPFKMQGSQNEWVIVLTLNCHKHMLNRQLQYTSLTRASKGVIEIGEQDAIRDCVDTLGDDNRSTWLLDLLNKDDTKD